MYSVLHAYMIIQSIRRCRNPPPPATYSKQVAHRYVLFCTGWLAGKRSREKGVGRLEDSSSLAFVFRLRRRRRPSGFEQNRHTVRNTKHPPVRSVNPCSGPSRSGCQDRHTAHTRQADLGALHQRGAVVLQAPDAAGALYWAALCSAAAPTEHSVIEQKDVIMKSAIRKTPHNVKSRGVCPC